MGIQAKGFNRRPLPKKILRIRELTFALEDDFEGTVDDAMKEFLAYRTSHRQNAEYLDPENLFSTFDGLMASPDARVCGDGVILELTKEGYKIVESTNPDADIKN